MLNTFTCTKCMMKHYSAYSRRWERAVTLTGIISIAIYQHFFLILGPPLPELYSYQFREGRRVGILNAEELCLFSPSLVLSNKVSSISPLSRSLTNFYLLNLTSQWTVIILSCSYADGIWPKEKQDNLFNVIQKIWCQNSAGIPKSGLWWMFGFSIDKCKGKTRH